jgi:transcriptional regulator with XRE-family HTH domain
MSGTTQKEVAERIGITFQLVSRYEMGQVRIPLIILMRYASALGTSAHELLEAALDTEAADLQLKAA